MLKELLPDLIAQLDVVCEFNPPEGIVAARNLYDQEYSEESKNRLKYFEAKALSTLNQFREAETISLECISKAIITKDYFILVRCNVLLGRHYIITNELQLLRPYLELAVEYAIQSEDLELLIYASSHYLNYLKLLSHFDLAIEEEKRLVNLMKRVPVSFTTAQTLMSIAHLRLVMGDHNAAIIYLREALSKVKSLNVPELQLTILNNLSSVYNAVQDYPQAEEILRRGLSMATELQHLKQAILFTFGIGNLKIATKDYEEAIQYFDKCLLLLDNYQTKPPLLLIDIYNNYSMCYWYMKDSENSLLYIDKAIEIAREHKLERDMVQIEMNKTNLLMDMGAYAEAKAVLDKTLKFYKQAKEYRQMIQVYRLIASLHAKQNDYKKSYEIDRKLDTIVDDYIAQIQKDQAGKESPGSLTQNLPQQDKYGQPGFNSRDKVLQGFIGRSKAWQNVLNSALLAAQHPKTSVLIMGESGTGKEVIAQMIHQNSIRRHKAFIPVNISALSASLIESELFGHTKGAFTGADLPTKGYFLQADKGTLFLDEVTEMPYELQSKLLRVLESHKVIAVGSSREVAFDSRIISATNQNIRESLSSSKFRLDLFHRLNTIEIVIPPLRERPEDIEPILQHYIEIYARELKKPKPRVENSLLTKMVNYNFPGNVRELKNIVERMFILSDNSLWDAQLLCKVNPFSFGDSEPTLLSQSIEEDTILKALIKTKGKQKDAARLLNMSEATLYRRIVKYKLQAYTRKGS